MHKYRRYVLQEGVSFIHVWGSFVRKDDLFLWNGLCLKEREQQFFEMNL